MLLLTPDEMGRADALAAASGIDSFQLMVKAGDAVAAAALRLHPEAARIVTLCGPGNNGGDGYIAAAALARSGVNVALFHAGDPARLKGDAAKARAACHLPSAPVSSYVPQDGDVVIDALFGAGLARPLEGDLSRLTETVNLSQVPVIAVDLPSGLCGRRGVVLGGAFKAEHTITFMAPKPGHFLMPGRDLCGTLEVFDIGIPRRILREAAGAQQLNGPDLWRQDLPVAESRSHKYKRGHLAVFSGGPGTTGAARLAARAGLKAGAGLVTLAVPETAGSETAAHLTAIMMKIVDDQSDLEALLDDTRISAFVLGPGFGIGEKARRFATRLTGRNLVLDADAITAFRDDPDALFSAFADRETHFVMTPHEGEFRRLFPDLAEDETLGKVEKATEAARRSNFIILYKGADTVIAAPDGRSAINADAPPWLATAGSGDVLAGIIGGLLAQGMPAFEAACAGAWLHGASGNRAGEGLTAEDLPEHLPPFSQLKAPS